MTQTISKFEEINTNIHDLHDLFSQPKSFDTTIFLCEQTQKIQTLYFSRKNSYLNIFQE